MPYNPKLVIAIDGPAGSGKSTVAGILAEKLGVPLLDTGAYYRGAAFAILKTKTPLENSEELLYVVKKTQLVVSSDTPNRVLVNDIDVTTKIRTLEIGQTASKISTISEIRQYLVRLQQQELSKGGRILEGRDVTTVVAPQADLKIFLTASIEERARRRWLQLRDEQQGLTLQAVVKDVVERDHRDYTRDDSPLMLAEDAHIVETFGISAEQAAERIRELLES